MHHTISAAALALQLALTLLACSGSPPADPTDAETKPAAESPTNTPCPTILPARLRTPEPSRDALLYPLNALGPPGNLCHCHRWT